MKTDNTSKLLIIVTAIFIASLMMGCIEEPFSEEAKIEGAIMESIIETETISSNDNCPNGGFLVKAGNDANENGLLEEEELTTINFLCHGENGKVAAELLTMQEKISANDNCPAGGVMVYVGSDANHDSDLSTDEIQSSFVLCHGQTGSQGTSGLTNLSKISNEEKGDNCKNGGYKVENGSDKNQNMILEADEIESTHYLCHGLDGQDGTDGLTTLTKSIDEPAGANCLNGGLRIQTGLDRNSNGLLDDSEIESTTYVCDGASEESEYYEYYFSNGLDGYSNTSDVSIAKMDNQGLDEEELYVGSEINPTNGFLYPTNSLIHFAGIESILNDLGESEYDVVESVLFVKIETPMIDGGEANALGVQVIVPNAPLFLENEANWNMAYTDQEWFDPGTAAIESSAYDYSDMVLLPDPSQMTFKGIVPLLLNRAQTKAWVENKDNNKGVVLTLIDQSREFNLTVSSSEHDDISYRPMLYIKVKKTEKAMRHQMLSDTEYKQNWLLKSTEDKLKAYRNIF